MKFIIFLFLIPLTSHAVFQRIYQGYVGSERVKSIHLDTTINAAKYDFMEAKNDWKFDVGAKFSDSFLKSLYSFQTNKTISNTLSLGLKRQTYKYGSFSISHSRISYDLSNWSASNLSSFTADKVYEAKNILNYSYDFLKQPQAYDWKIGAQQKVADDFTTHVNFEKDALEFYQAYVDTKLRVVLNRLYVEFEKRAKKRVRLISKRVTDGLSRSIDLNQSKLALLGQQETILKNKTKMKEKIYLLENIIGFQVPEEQYIDIQWKYKSEDQFPFIRERKKQFELERLKSLQELTELNMKKIKNETGHSLSMSLAYTKNAVSEIESDSLSNSLDSGNNDEKIASLVYTIPFGQGKKSALERQLFAQNQKHLIDLATLKGDFKVKEISLNDNLKAYSQAIALVKTKIAIAKESINESQRLYFRGQSSFEDLLRSEETYLNAEISFVNLLAIYEQSMGQLAYINGQTKKYLESYTD